MTGKKLRLPNESNESNLENEVSPIHDGPSHNQYPSEYDFSPKDVDKECPEMVTDSHFNDISFESEEDHPTSYQTCPECGRCPCLTSSKDFQDLLATKLTRPFMKGIKEGFPDNWMRPVMGEVMDVYYESIQVNVDKRFLTDATGETRVEKQVHITQCAINYAMETVKSLHSNLSSNS